MTEPVLFSTRVALFPDDISPGLISVLTSQSNEPGGEGGGTGVVEVELVVLVLVLVV